MSNKKFPNLKKASNSDEITALIAGMEASGDGYFVTEDQAIAIETALNGHATAILAVNNDLSTSQSALTTAQEQLTAANAQLQAANTTIATHVATIAERDARIVALENEGPIAQTKREKDQEDKVPFHESDNDPANLLADSLFGKPVAKK